MIVLRRCSANRANEVVHLFREGNRKTLCDREIGETWRVRPNDEIPTCDICVRKIPRSNIFPFARLKQAN